MSVNIEDLESQNIIEYSAEDVRVKFSEGQYYDDAEEAMEPQWNNIIYPLIKNCDFSRVLELSPGHGRNTDKLKDLSEEIHLVDYNKSCIDSCITRFKNYRGPCRLYFYVNDGKSLPLIQDDSISLVYSWDSMVHFNELLIREYIKEFTRILQPGGMGFIHHSNFGNISNSSEVTIDNNPGWRSNMTAEKCADYCIEFGLKVEKQQILDWSVEKLDCITVFRK